MIYEKIRPPLGVEGEIDQFTGSYQEWMQQQLETTHAFVKEVLGQKRFKLFKSGKLTII